MDDPLQNDTHDLSLLPGCKEKGSPEQQDERSSLVQMNPEHPHIKEEQQERSISLVQENPEPLKIKEEPRDELQRPEEADASTLTDRAEFLHLSVCKVEVSPKQQERNYSSLVQEEPEAPQIKEEPQEQLLQTPEEAGGGSALTSVAVKSEEDDDDDRETGPLAGASTERMTTRSCVQAGVEDCGTSRPTRDDQLLSSSDVTEDSEDWEETREGQSALNTLKSHVTQNEGGQTSSLSSKLSQDLKTSKQTHSARGDKERTSLSCTVCGKVGFGKMHLLKRHMRTHTGEKPFACAVCDQRFSQTHHMKQHMRTHTGEKPFSCTVCQKSFAQRSHLNTHMRTHAELTPFTCAVCQKILNCKSNLKKHMRTHSDEKPFACTVCGQKFGHKHNLKTHMIIHTGEKPYTCMVCQKRFSQSTGMKAHVRTHTGEKPFSCDICPRKFFYKHSLKNHIRIHTGE